MNSRPPEVLIVDDRRQDAELVSVALRRRVPEAVPLLARDGAEALTVLRERPVPPRVILLDLKMQRVDGFELLERLKGDGATRSIPVVVLTSSALASDVRRAYSLGANSYVVKPMAFEDLVDTVALIGEYWLRIDVGPGADVASETGGPVSL